jgi:hypothetical protein
MVGMAGMAGTSTEPRGRADPQLAVPMGRSLRVDHTTLSQGAESRTALCTMPTIE